MAARVKHSWRPSSASLSKKTAARGFLRAQIAAAIHRKRTPELVFELLGGIDEAGSVVDGEGEVK